MATVNVAVQAALAVAACGAQSASASVSAPPWDAEAFVQVKLKTAPEGGVAPRFFQAPAVPNSSAFPIRWFHVPKTGNSFLNAITRIPGACEGLPHELVIDDEGQSPVPKEDWGASGFWMRYWDSCNNFAHETRGTHAGVGSNQTSFEAEWAGRGVTMLRQPEQRLLSAFHYNRISWPLSKDHPLPSDPLTFALQVQGCAVRQLTRDGMTRPAFDAFPMEPNALIPFLWGGPCGEGPPPTSAEVEEARRRLHRFRFVGLLEEWDLSICLLHATYGGTCHRAEFINSLGRKKRVYDVAQELGNWTDQYDGALYAEAQKIFWTRFEDLGLSREACRPCLEQADPKTGMSP